MEIKSNERTLVITAPSGDSLEFDKESERVEISGSVDYSVLMKLIKVLKKEKNKQSFAIEYFDGDNEEENLDE